MNLIKLFIMALMVVVSMDAVAFIGPTGQSNSTDPVSGDFITREREDIWVINSGAAASKGSVMCVDTTDDDGYRVSECSVLGAPAICVAIEAIGANARGLCRREGYISQVNFIENGNATEDATVGLCMYASDTDAGGVQGLAFDTAAVSGQQFPRCLGIFLDGATAADTALEAYIDL